MSARASMSCGHTAQSFKKVGGEWAPACVICADSTPVAAPDLTGRMMQCSYTAGRDGKPCASRLQPIPSDRLSAFFKHNPDSALDQFYCGCWGDD